MTYKCVFSDIDGTLLNSKHQISEKTKKKVQQLAIQNIPFILVSARMPKGMHYFLDELQIKAPMVSYSGGLILDENIITGLKPEKLDLNGVKKVHKLLVIAEAGIVDRLEMSLKEKFRGLKIYKSKDTYLEIMDESVSKSNAIQFLCDKMKIGLHQTVSFGDNYNDLDMLLLTGKGFAMANGAQGVLESIPTHTLSNDEDGIVYALDNLVGE